MNEVRKRCIEAIERKIVYYKSMRNAEDKLSAWYLVTGYIEAMCDAGIITIEEFREFSNQID